MFSKQIFECGLEVRKYLYIVGVLAVIALAGSYWYLNYFLDEIGLESERSSSDQPMSMAAASAAGAAGAMVALGQQGVTAPVMVPATPAMPAQGMGAVATPVAGFFAAPDFGASGASQDQFAQVVQSILPSVVNVSTQNTRDRAGAPVRAAMNNSPAVVAPAVQPADPAAPDGGLRYASPYSGVALESIGSGVIVTADGYVVSNYHVVENSQNIFVTVFGPQGTQRYPADLVHQDPSRDLVLLKIQPTQILQPASLGNSDMLQVGESVITVGCPFGLDQTVSKGIVSGARKAVTIEGVIHKDLIQTDAAINQGNSGGPLVSRGGQVVGINTAIYSPTQAFSGVGFAVPVNSVREFITEVIPLPDVAPGVGTPMTIRGLPIAAPGGGGRLPPPIPANAVAPHGDRGPCESCHQILTNGQLVNFNQWAMPSSTLGVVPSVPGGAFGSNIALPQSALTAMGAEFKLLDPYLVQRFKPPFADGVFVQQVQPGSLAEQSGLMAGDIIFKLNGRWVRSPEEMFGNLSTYNVGDRVRFSLVRNQARRDVFVTLSTPPVGAQQQPAQTLGVAPAGAPVLSGMPPAAGTGMTAMQTAPVAGAPAKPAKKPAPVKTEFEWQGMELQPIQSNAVGKTPAMKGKQGAVVQEMDPGLAAEKAGVLANDIILAINGLPVATNAELDKAINATVKAKSIILDVDRAGQRVLIPLK